MNRNTESHFSQLPQVGVSRSTFDRSHSIKTSFNVGDLIPFMVEEVLPGDTFKIKTNKVVRLQTLLTPVMDNIYLDTYYFFVPNRLCWEHWRQLMGENTESAWLPATQYSVPQLEAPAGGWNVGTIADYMGIPTGVENLSVNALPFRAYALICDQWFRDENLTDPLNVPLTDTTVVGVNTGNYISDTAKGGLPFKASKYHDYFTSCLPAPQKGPSVPLPVAAGEGGTLPVFGNGYGLGLTDGTNVRSFSNEVVGGNLSFGVSGKPVGNESYGQTCGSRTVLGVPTSSQLGDHPEYSGLIADGSAFQISVGTINELRQAFQLQKLYERDARGGSRYIELLKSHFGVTSPDGRLQRPEYLGGNRVPINVNQVVQQSGSVSGQTAQGTVTGMSLTTDSHFDFSKSFVEHGFVIGVMVARYDHTYQQGLDRMWSRNDRFDYYWPVFANIGEQAVKNKEIYAQGTAVVDSDGKIVDDKVFGYQEAWADYRYKPNRVTGEMRSTYAQSLDVWHLGDDYASLPALSDAWIREDKSNVDRVLAVKSTNSNQLFCDLYIQNQATRPMPMYSIPGLMDHN